MALFNFIFENDLGEDNNISKKKKTWQEKKNPGPFQTIRGGSCTALPCNITTLK